MTKQERLTRDVVIQNLVDALEPLDYVHAFYEGGAAAFDRIDKWSDIDLYVVVDDEKVEETFLAVEKVMRALSDIKQKYEIPKLPWPGIFQAFYRLEDASEYLLIDLVVLRLSSPEKFLETEIHGNVIFYFNKAGKIKQPPLDKGALFRKLQERLERLQARLAMFSNFTQKELNRGNYLEAIDFYHAITLATLVEALRIRHNPVHYNFKMHYIHYELPPRTIMKLENLYFVKDQKDLQEKYHEATRWIHKILSEMDQEEMERLVRMP